MPDEEERQNDDTADPDDDENVEQKLTSPDNGGVQTTQEVKENYCCCKTAPSNLFGIATCVSMFLLISVAIILFLLCTLIYFTDVIKDICGTLGLS